MTDQRLSLTTRRRFLTTALGAAGALFGLGARRDTAAASPPGRLALYNTHTRETLDVTFRDAGGLYDARALAAIDHVLRCHYTGLATHMDLGVLEFLSTVDRRFGGPGVPLRAVRDEARALGLGGVGYYPASEFVHLDSGPSRSW